MDGQKKWIAHAPLLPGDGGSKLSQPLSPGVACAVVRHSRRTDDWMDGHRSRHTDDTDVLLRIHHVIGELPTYGYRRVWALLRRQAELDGMPAINAKRVYRIMRQNALLLERKPTVPPSKRAHTGRVAVKESNQAMVALTGSSSAVITERGLRVTFALDCCDREALHWAVTTGGFNSETVQDVMLGAVGTPLRQRSSVVSSGVADG